MMKSWVSRPGFVKTIASGWFSLVALPLDDTPPVTASTVARENLENHETATSPSSSPSSSVFFAVEGVIDDRETVPYKQKFDPPEGVNYEDNPTIFGKILRGETPAAVLAERPDMMVFRDAYPNAPLHDLVIPKRLIPSIFELEAADLPLLYDMKQMALEQVERQAPEAFENNDYRLVFHVPPFNSVDHLHLHVIAPVSEMRDFYREIKYKGDSRACVGVDMILKRLEEGRTAMPYAKPNNSAVEWFRALFRPR